MIQGPELASGGLPGRSGKSSYTYRLKKKTLVYNVYNFKKRKIIILYYILKLSLSDGVLRKMRNKHRYDEMRYLFI